MELSGRVSLALQSKNLQLSQWELVLSDLLHSIRSLLCTATNETPHEKMFKHNGNSASGQSLPKWLMKQGNVLMKRHNRASKYDLLVDEVELFHSNVDYAHVKLPDGRETTVSTKHLAPYGVHSDSEQNSCDKGLFKQSENQCENNQPVVEPTINPQDYIDAPIESCSNQDNILKENTVLRTKKKR